MQASMIRDSGLKLQVSILKPALGKSNMTESNVLRASQVLASNHARMTK